MTVDNTSEIQAAINSAKGSFTIPNGQWYIDATRGLLVPSGLTLNVVGTLLALPNDQDWTHIIFVNGVENVTINLSGQVIGDSLKHEVTTGQHGMGIMLQDSTNVSLSGDGIGIVSQCWGDGIYVQGCTNIIIDGIVSTGNRRQGMSVISVDGLNVSKSAFNYTSGTAPSAGIDLEPDLPSEFIKNVEISNSQFVGNAGCGINFGFGGAPKSNFVNVNVLSNNLFKNNKPISGLNGPLANFLYATCRWLPSYDWWGFPTTASI